VKNRLTGYRYGIKEKPRSRTGYKTGTQAIGESGEGRTCGLPGMI
jgi:hypothetical protein